MIVANDDNFTFIQCDCGTEGIALEVDDYDYGCKDGTSLPLDLYISFYNMGFQGRTFRFKDKLRLLWRIITKGTPYTDMVCLNKTSAQKVVDFIQTRYLSK
jgi:hypothetical protein